LASARWSPDSKSIIGIQELQLQLIIWSLMTTAIVTIRSPKQSEMGVDFSRDGRFMAVLEKYEGKDQVGVYFTGDWTQVKLFPIDTVSAEDLVWTGRGQIVVWDGLLACNCLVYSAEGTIVTRIPLEGMTMGVKIAENSGEFIALGLNEPNVRLLSTISWKQIADFQHSVTLPDHHGPIYQETEQILQSDFSMATRTTVRFTLLKSLSKLPVSKQQKAFPCPVSTLSWSADSHYIATRCELTPCVVHIWSTDTCALEACLMLLAPIRSLAWSPTRPMLAIATGSGYLYLWSEEGAAVCEVPRTDEDSREPPFSVLKARWNATGSTLLLMDRSSIRLAYPQYEAAL
jgi:WD40 repeat protein